MAKSTLDDGDLSSDTPGMDSTGSDASNKNVSGSEVPEGGVSKGGVSKSDVLGSELLERPEDEALDHGSLDHKTIEAQSLLERYHLGTLPPREEVRLEAHLMDCAACQEELEIQRSFLRGMKTVAGEEAARFVVGVRLLSWLQRRGFLSALAALLVVGAGAWMALLWSQNQRLESQVAALGEAGSIATPIATPIGGGVLASPLAGVPVVLLSVLRGDSDPSERVLDEGDPYSLAIDGGADPRISTYSITILDEAGKVCFAGQNLVPNNLEVIQLTFPSGYFPSGEYRLRAEGSLPGGESVDAGSYPFRVEVGEKSQAEAP